MRFPVLGGEAILLCRDVEDLEEEEAYQRALALISEERRKKVASFKVGNARRLSLGAGLVLREGLLSLGLDPLSELIYGEQGKPYLKEGGAFFNLSHSGEKVLGIFSRYEVGCDIQENEEEKRRKKQEKERRAEGKEGRKEKEEGQGREGEIKEKEGRTGRKEKEGRVGEGEKIYRRFFHPEEIRYLDSLPEKERERSFYALWSMKEAYIKALGEGLSCPLDSFWIDFSNCLVRKGESVKLERMSIPGYELAWAMRME